MANWSRCRKLVAGVSRAAGVVLLIVACSWRSSADIEGIRVPSDEEALRRQAYRVPITDERKVAQYLEVLCRRFPGTVWGSDVYTEIGAGVEGPILTAVEVVGLPSTPYLVRLMNDRRPRTRELAALTIARIGDDSGIPHLARALHDTEPAVRAAAAYGLGMLRATEALPRLVRAQRDRDYTVRRAVAYALGALRVRGAIPALINLLGDDDRHVRSVAVKALEGLGCPEPVPAMIPLLEDDDGFVRFRAAEALRTLTFGIVTVQSLPYDPKQGFRRKLPELAAAYRDFWRTHCALTNDDLMREAVDIRVSIIRAQTQRNRADYQELYAPLERITPRRLCAPGVVDPVKRWWARYRDRPAWEWAIGAEAPQWYDQEDAQWGLVVREGGIKAVPLLVAFGRRDRRSRNPEALLLKHLTLIDLGFAKGPLTESDRSAAADAWRRWYTTHRATWDVRAGIRRALPSATEEDFWIAVKTLRWLRDYSAVPLLIERLKSGTYTDVKRAADELERLTGRHIGRHLRPWESDVQRRNLAANWRLWWQRNASVVAKRPAPLPTPPLMQPF